MPTRLTDAPEGVPLPLLGDPRIAPFTGVFVDRLLESEFRRDTREEWARRVATVGVVASILLLGFGYVDWHFLGPGPKLVAMWAARGSLVIAAFAVAAALRRTRSVASLDQLALVLTAGITFIVLCVVYIQRKGIAFETPATLLGVIGFYLFIPQRLSRQVSSGVLLAASFLWAQAEWGPSAPVAWASALTQLAIANVLGYYTALRNHMLLRREYVALAQARRMALSEGRRKEELQQSVGALERSNAELEQFAYVASHDLQAPLRNIISFAQLAEKRAAEPAGRAGEYLDTVVRSAHHMQRLITDLLALSRVGHGSPPFVRVETQQVLADVEYQLASVILEKQAQVTHGPLPSVPGSPIELMQLFQNLLDNSLKFQPPGNVPKIHVTARRNGTGWEFSVRDNGIGVAREHRERIFQIFQRLHDDRSYAGTGIGLAICKKVVQRHGGQIRVDSEPGQGATFTFTLPSQYAQAFPG